MAGFSGEHLELQIVEREGAPGETRAFLRIHNSAGTPLGSHWRLYFSLGLTPVATETRVRQHLIDGRYGYLEPTADWVPVAPESSLEIEVENWLFNRMPLRARQGFHFTSWTDGNAEALSIPTTRPPSLLPLTELQNTWIRDLSPSSDTTAQTAESIWHKNLRGQTPIAGTTIIPKPSVLEQRGSDIRITGLAFASGELEKVLSDFQSDQGIRLSSSISSQLPPESYELDASAELVSIRAGSDTGLFYAAQTLRQLIRREESQVYLTPCRIQDQPDFSHRGLFLDIARHFQSGASLRRLIEAMASYKMNRLQLGISNDEGWRLEIPGIPELTDIGARRCFYANDETGKPRGLYPAWGDGPDEEHQFLSREEFVDLLEFAQAHHVEVILEFNLPAHANALIRAMSASGRYQIVEPEDASRHSSAQGYTNNVVNICLPETYELAEAILREFSACYQAAKVPFSRVHLGGDEVPAGAWLHSPACRQSEVWDQTWNVDNEADALQATERLTSFYAQSILAVVNHVSPDTEVGFWHEMSPSLPPASNCYVTGWTTEAGDRNLIDELLVRDQRLVIANASFLYLDMPYGLQADEPGLPWAAYIDSERIFDFDSLGCWHIKASQRPQVNGIQAQLWSETAFTSALMDYYLFPRLLCVAERAWRSKPEPDAWPGFALAVGHRELIHLDSLGISYRLPPPGATVIDNELHANVVFPGLTIRYTLDGTDPTAESETYSGPVPIKGWHECRLATFSHTGDRASRISTVVIQ